MPIKKASGAQTGFNDKDGKPILVHAHVADANGATYYINAYSQAVPTGDGVAVELERLSKESELRVLSAQEVLKLQPSVPVDKPKAKRAPRGSSKRLMQPRQEKPADPAPAAAPAEVPAPAPASAPAPADKPEDPAVKKNFSDIEKAEIKAEIKMLLQTFPDYMLADELRRRGYVFSAVKPVIVQL